MLDLSTRSEEVEIMDDLACSGPVVDQTLAELEFINTWLGGNAITLAGLSKLLARCTGSLTVADLGCGGGDMLVRMGKVLKRKNRAAQLIGFDANPNIVAYAQQKTSAHPNITIKTANILSDAFKTETFDLVFATLFFHHFTHEQLIGLFKHLGKSTRCGIVVNDLHRHWLAYYSIKYLTRWFSRSAMVMNDAPLSVYRGFKRAELVQILAAAGITNYSLRWKWAFRWQLVVYTGDSLA